MSKPHINRIAFKHALPTNYGINRISSVISSGWGNLVPGWVLVHKANARLGNAIYHLAQDGSNTETQTLLKTASQAEDQEAFDYLISVGNKLHKKIPAPYPRVTERVISRVLLRHVFSMQDDNVKSLMTNPSFVRTMTIVTSTIAPSRETNQFMAMHNKIQNWPSIAQAS